MRKRMIRVSLITNFLFIVLVGLYSVLSSPQISIIGLNPLKVLDNAVYDYNLKKTMSHAPHEDIFVVAIDDYTVEALGRFPFDRDYYIPFLESVRPAKAIAFPAPVATDAPDPSLPRGPRVEPIRVEASTGVKLLIAAWFAGTLASLLVSPALFLLLALSSFYIVQMHSVRVRVDDAGVHLRMLLGETIPLETITAARPARYDWGDSGGVGIRGVGYRGSRGKRIAVAARSGEALDVDTTGHNWTIVVPDGAAERIAGDINARLDARPGPRP